MRNKQDWQKLTIKDKSIVICNILAVIFLFSIIVLLIVNRVNNYKTTETNDNYPFKQDYVNVVLVDDYCDLIKEEDLKEYTYNFEQKYSYSIADIITNDFFKGVGASKPNIELTTHKGETINLTKVDGNIALEVIADWCSFCQIESREYFAQTIEENPDITFVQYMLTGGKEEVEAFYQEIDKDIPNNLIIVYQNDELTRWLEDNGFDSFPTFYLFNNTKVVGACLGALAPEYFEAIKYLTYGETPLYELKTASGLGLEEQIRQIKIAKEYIANLESIDVPKELFDER